MRIPGLPAARRLRHGQLMSEPMNWPLRNCAGYTRYMIWPPHMACSGIFNDLQLAGFRLMPCILPRPYYLTEVGIYQTGLGSANDKARLCLFDTLWKVDGGYSSVPYPGRKLWEGSEFNFGSGSGTFHTFTVNKGLPGNKLFWLGYKECHAEFGSGEFMVWDLGGSYPVPYPLWGTLLNNWLLSGDGTTTIPDTFPLGASKTTCSAIPVWHCTIGDPP